MKNVNLKEKKLYGWSVLEFTSKDVCLSIAPEIGGRIISLKHQGEEILFVQDEQQGEVFDFKAEDDLRALKKKMGFRLWGGDKTWLAPQKLWWEDIPPLELDAGRYDFQIHQNSVEMTSPLCRETGVQITRRVKLSSDQEIILDQSIRTESSEPVKRGIWDVTQCLRPFAVYLPASREKIRAYKDEGLKEEADQKIAEEYGWVKINCDDATHFKFGGFIETGQLVAVKESEKGFLAFARSFDIDPGGTYAHQAMTEVYNSPAYDYLEIEVHAPLVPLAKGESASHRQTWQVRRFHNKEEVADEFFRSVKKV